MATDKELVKRVQNGESEAYAELYQRYYRHIYTMKPYPSGTGKWLRRALTA